MDKAWSDMNWIEKMRHRLDALEALKENHPSPWWGYCRRLLTERDRLHEALSLIEVNTRNDSVCYCPKCDDPLQIVTCRECRDVNEQATSILVQIEKETPD